MLCPRLSLAQKKQEIEVGRLDKWPCASTLFPSFGQRRGPFHGLVFCLFHQLVILLAFVLLFFSLSDKRSQQNKEPADKEKDPTFSITLCFLLICFLFFLKQIKQKKTSVENVGEISLR